MWLTPLRWLLYLPYLCQQGRKTGQLCGRKRTFESKETHCHQPGEARKVTLPFVMGFPDATGVTWSVMKWKNVCRLINFMRDTIAVYARLRCREKKWLRMTYRIQYAAKACFHQPTTGKNAIGMNEGLVRLKVLDRKKREQEQLLAFGDSITKWQLPENESIKQIVAQRHAKKFTSKAIYEALMLGNRILKYPIRMPWEWQSGKPETERHWRSLLLPRRKPDRSSSTRTTIRSRP